MDGWMDGTTSSRCRFNEVRERDLFVYVPIASMEEFPSKGALNEDTNENIVFFTDALFGPLRGPSFSVL